MEIVIPIATGTKARNIIAREREIIALRMRKEGKTYLEIAKEFGVTDVAVHKMVKKILTRMMSTTAEEVEDVKQLELNRLDALIAANWEYAMQADEKSAAVILRCMDRRASLLGLDAPKKIEHTEMSDIDRQLEALIARFKSSRQVPPTVEIDCTTEPVDSGRPMERLVMFGGEGLGKEDRHSDPDTDA